MSSNTESLNLLVPESYRPLHPLEVKLIKGCTKGQTVLGNYDGTIPSEQNNTIRGEFLAWLCGDKDANKNIYHTGIIVENALFEGSINLEGATIEFPLKLRNCKFNSQLNFNGAHVLNLDLSGSYLEQGLTADFINSQASILLCKGFISKDRIALRGANILGNLFCDESSFWVNENEDDNRFTLNASLASIRGDVSFQRSRVENGTVYFEDAQITGSVICAGAYMRNPNGISISLERAKISGTVFLCRDKRPDKCRKFRSFGTVRLHEARIEGALECDYGRFDAGNNVVALEADGLHAGAVLLRNGFTALGCLHLYGARVIELDCSKSSFRKSPGDTKNECFVGDNMVVDGECRWLNLLRSPNGTVSFTNLSAKSFLTDTDSWVVKKHKSPIAVYIFNILALLLDMSFLLKSFFFTTSVRMDGFTYDHFRHDVEDHKKTSPHTRIINRRIWLHLRPTNHKSLQPYSEVIKTLKMSGHTAEARKIAIEREVQRNKHLPLWQALPRMFFLGLTVDYGYSPWKALIFILLFIYVGITIFKPAQAHGVIVPAQGQVDRPSQQQTNDQNEKFAYPNFVPLAYSIDVFLPIVNLHQEDYWIPAIDSDKCTNPEDPCWKEGVKVMNYMWLHIVFGWILSTIFVSAITGIIRTDVEA